MKDRLHALCNRSFFCPIGLNDDRIFQWHDHHTNHKKNRDLRAFRCKESLFIFSAGGPYALPDVRDGDPVQGYRDIFPQG